MILFTLFGILVIGLALYDTGYGLTNNFSVSLQKQTILQSSAFVAFLLSIFLTQTTIIDSIPALFVNIGFVGMLSYIVTTGIQRILPATIVAALCGGVVFPILLRMIEPGGYLSQISYTDGAGAGLVHFLGGLSALLVSIYTSKFKTRDTPIVVRPYPATAGFLVLWVGWVTYIALISLPYLQNGIGVWLNGLINLSTSTAWGAVAAVTYMWLSCGRVKMRTCTVGGLAGLVAASADPFNIPVWGAMLLGATGGILATMCYGFLCRFKLNDPTNAISIHLLPGVIGVLTVPMFNEAAFLSSQFLGIVTIVSLASCIGVFTCELYNTPMSNPRQTNS